MSSVSYPAGSPWSIRAGSPALADLLGDMISAHAPDGTYRYASAAARELLGYEPSDLVGTWCYDYFHPDDVAHIGGAHRSALDGVPLTVVYRLRRKAGDYVWVESTTRVVADEAGEIAEIICSTRPAHGGRDQRDSASHEACRKRVSAILDTEAITPLYQPIVALGTGRIVAYEALARFPGDAAHSPERWFADAWSVGLGVPLELLAVRAAARALPHLRADLHLAINASPETVATHGFAAAIGDAIERVVIEITEHRQLDSADVRVKLAPLRAAGGRIAIDDFGAGHASLSQVLAITPDWIKLDLALTQNLRTDPVARALAVALVSFAGEVGVGVVAEGVETAEQAEMLADIGIRHAQGWHFGRPVPLEALANSAS
ncbi:MAG: EAL domain-containing protein [Conexibacter sp.]